MIKSEIKKVVAQVKEIYVKPEFEAIYNCPYCNRKHYREVFDENFTITQKCHGCKKYFKVKIPK